MSDTGALLRAKYGTPTPMPGRGELILAWRHASEESARAFAEANGEEGSVLFEDGAWLSVVDLRARVAAISASLTADA